ncbi:MAG: ATP-binding cassette domain-containing protein [Acidimicrobiia bacterium]|nr:ATP-binding cassette domain-containing protein [Acidimicrobiia bacterium]
MAVDNVSLRVEPGQVVGLIGPNGAGKTTLIDAVTGFVRPAGGEVVLDGASVNRWSARRRAVAGMGRSFQGLELFETMSVRDNLLTASDRRDALAYLTDLVRPGRGRLGPAAAAAVSDFELAEDLDRRVDELSYGRRRLVAIARAIATEPSVLLLDEPAAGLDPVETEELGRLVRRLADEWGLAVLLVEHDVKLVLDVCDRVAVLDFGRRIAEGEPDVVRHDPLVVAAYLGVPAAEEPSGELAPVEPVAAGPASAPVGVREPVRVGERVPAADPPPRPDGAPLVEARGLSAGYGDLAAVRDLDLVVRPGEVVALLGPNGAGKTTTLLTLAGELAPLAGEVRWLGSTRRAPLHRRVRAGLGFVPEERSVIMSLTAGGNLRLGRGSAAAACEMFPELSPLLRRRAGLLSGGEQQILTLARALAAEPRLLLADELSLGLAPMVVDRLLACVREAADRGVGVLLVEQRARDALDVADRVYVLRQGAVQLEAEAADLAGRFDDLERAYLSGTGAD